MILPRSIERLITLPPAASKYAREAGNGFLPAWRVSSDPDGRKLGSGAGTIYALWSAWKENASGIEFEDWLNSSQKLIVHGGGESRRLPACSVLGKPLISLPPAAGLSFAQPNSTLLDLQAGVYESLLAQAEWASAMVASGDVLVRFQGALSSLPMADIVIFGKEIEPDSAQQFGALFVDKGNPERLQSFVQKPCLEEARNRLLHSRLLVDTGGWLLGPRAIELLLEMSGWREADNFEETIRPFELYAGIGPCLGSHPAVIDTAVNALSVAVKELPKADFLHFGSTRQMCDSVKRMLSNDHCHSSESNRVILNSTVAAYVPNGSGPLWIADSVIPDSWRFADAHVITGVPDNRWSLDIPSGVCLDMTPIEGDQYVLRGYGLDDSFRGRMDSETTIWFGRPAGEWFESRAIRPSDAGIRGEMDFFDAPLFPVISPDEDSDLVQWILDIRPLPELGSADWWKRSKRLSAREIARTADIGRMLQNRQSRSLKGTAQDDQEGFRSLRQAIVNSALSEPATPRRNVLEDQIVWSRCPVRLDFAGGWTDTPPYCILNGGSVLNAAVELNGQPPIQVFAKLSRNPEIVIRSIDLGVEQRITSYDQLGDYANPRSDFSLARAALAIAGLHPQFSAVSHDSLRHQLEELGGGIEVSLLAAVPQGSGLGTSSILAATVLAAISDLYGMAWNHQELIARTLSIEQLVTTGGGWQDQAGGILHGVKLLESDPGLPQTLRAERLPEGLLTEGIANGAILLYYTGLTRLAKGILQEVVRGMFVAEPRRAALLKSIRSNATAGAESIRRGNWDGLCHCVRESWRLNQELDSGTNPPEVQAILNLIQDYVQAAKLLGAGGGGYLLLFARDEDAGGRIRRELRENPPNARARFVDLGISQTGLETTRS